MTGESGEGLVHPPPLRITSRINVGWIPSRVFLGLLLLSPLTSHLSPARAGELPSLFRGVVVVDSALGVRVVSVEESSQASQADLRPEDLIVRIGEGEVHSIDDFAVLSSRLKQDHTVTVTALVFRNGVPLELTLHIYSYPVLRRWGVAFVPEHDVRFAQPQTGLDYWRRLGRGFEEAGKPAEALNACLNGLHVVPDDLETALEVSRLLVLTSRNYLASKALAEGVGTLRQAITILQHAFDVPLTDEQLREVKRQLEEALEALQTCSATFSATQNM